MGTHVPFPRDRVRDRIAQCHGLPDFEEEMDDADKAVIADVMKKAGLGKEAEDERKRALKAVADALAKKKVGTEGEEGEGENDDFELV